ncbi:MAG: ShlB/FhaC/HecB family hemolysin secretion/activation protein [Cyanobacteriota bacterium]|nr:ShlB/FhaC/HecB family hemolysin secretion/activation protein [Cyanobacteriota bacterium]
MSNYKLLKILGLVAYSIIVTEKSAIATISSSLHRELEFAQFPSPQDFEPPVPTVPQPSPQPPPPAPDLAPSSPSFPPASPPEIDSDRIQLRGFEFEGNTAFPSEELEQKLVEFLNQSFTRSQLQEIVTQIRNLYYERGYRTTGIRLLVPDETEQNREGIVKIEILEDEIEAIEILGTQRLNSGYVRSRLQLATSKPLNTERLQEALQLLQRDPLIQSVRSRLSAAPNFPNKLLVVEIEEAPTFFPQMTLDNGRAPSIGSFQRRAGVTEANVLGLGDGFTLYYTNTDGSNVLDLNYTVPINPRNGTLQLHHSRVQTQVIEPDFEKLDIESAAQTYEITARQPILQQFRDRAYREVALGFTFTRRESEVSLLGIPFPPLSVGADELGRTRVSAFRFFQEWTLQNATEVIAARSQFNLGVGLFDATINSPIPVTNEFVPDSRFFSWQGQAQWVKLLAPDTTLLVRSNVQLASRGLLPSEQFSAGGLGTVRGYRQDTLVGDNGFFASAELRIPLLSFSQPRSLLQVVPFADYAVAWNSSDRIAPNPNRLASVGVGLLWQIENLTARLEYGIPLISTDTKARTWQENGILFSVQWNLGR